VPPRYRSSYFLHIWGNGYDAGYYAYLWCEMLDDDASSGLKITAADAGQWRSFPPDGALARQHRRLAKMYAAWIGAEPEIGPMLKCAPGAGNEVEVTTRIRSLSHLRIRRTYVRRISGEEHLRACCLFAKIEERVLEVMIALRVEAPLSLWLGRILCIS